MSEYIKQCTICNSKKFISQPVSEKPNYSSGPMQRIQIDLIDLRSHPDPDRDQKWIVQAKNHFSQFTWAKSLDSTQCKD